MNKETIIAIGDMVMFFFALAGVSPVAHFTVELVAKIFRKEQ